MVDMNSIPQQEVANGKGQSEFALASPTNESKLVAKKPCPSNPGGDSTILMFELLISTRCCLEINKPSIRLKVYFSQFKIPFLIT